jgi:hypothetical protein
MKKQRRKLSIITQDLRIALKRETTDIIGIGDLLIEAKEHLKHGKWLPWLKKEFSLSDRSARNYMQAAKFAAKSETVSDLGNLSPSALYAISSDGGAIYTPEIIKAILQEAKKSRVGKDRAWDIALSLMPEEDEKRPPTPKELQQLLKGEAEAAAKDKEEAEAILDGPPPDLPPAAPMVPVDFVLAQFNNAIKALEELQTKSVNRFTSTTHSADELKKVADFLFAVANAVKSDRVIEGSLAESPARSAD